MTSSTPLSLNEVKQLQVDLLIEFDKFCRENGITYFLGWGSLLGAIRHKGYIPWDDDIDVMVPRPEIDKLLKIYKGKNSKIINIDNCKSYVFPFPRLVSEKTFCKSGKKAITHGVFIDVYPIDAYPLQAADIKDFLNKYHRISRVRNLLIKIQRHIYKYLPISKFPLIRSLTKKQQQLLSSNSYQDCWYVQVCDTRVPPFPKSLFDEKCEVEFEGRKYYAPKNWHLFLRMCYGDYMKLPPEDKRHPYHGTDSYYWKDQSEII